MTNFRVPKLSLMDNTYQAPTRAYLMFPVQWCDVVDPKDVAFFRSRPERFEEEGVPRPTKTKLAQPMKVPTVPVMSPEAKSDIAPPEAKFDKK